MNQEQGKAIIRILACVLDKLVQKNDLSGYDNHVSKFHGRRPPNITICDYLDRIHKFAQCSEECFILSLIYIDRLIQKSTFIVNSLNIHRVLITSVMLAAKYFDDFYYNNAYYAKVGGVQGHEINMLELDFLFHINFSLFVTTEEYNRYHSQLVNHASADNNNVCLNCVQYLPLLRNIEPEYEEEKKN